MKTRLKQLWKEVVTFLKQNGLWKMTDEEIIALIPTDALHFDQLFEEIKKLKRGQSKTYIFDPRDLKSLHTLDEIIPWVALHNGCTVYANYNVQPRKGKYEFYVEVH